MWKTVGKYRVYVAVVLAFGLSAVFAYQALAQNPDIPPPDNIRVQSTKVTSPATITWTWDEPTVPDGYGIYGYQVWDQLTDGNPIFTNTNSFTNDVEDAEHNGCSKIRVRTCTAVSGSVCTDFSDWSNPPGGATCLKPDLKVKDISISTNCADSSYTITATIENVGAEVADSQWYTKFISKDITVCSAEPASGPVGRWHGSSPNTKTVSCRVNCSQSGNSYACMQGIRTILVHADINNDISEENEKNNSKSKEFNIDLCVDFKVKKYGSSWNNTQVCKNQEQVYQYQVENVGDKDDGYMYNRLYVDNSYVSNQQEFISSTITSGGGVRPATPGTSCNSTGTMCWTPASTGSYSLVIKTDTGSGTNANTLDCASGDTGTVTEKLENNNCSSALNVSVIDIPSDPSSISFSNTTKSSTSLSWTQSSYVSTYDLYRCTGSTCSRPANPTYSGITTNSYTDTNLSCGKTYRYWVKANNTCGSIYSQVGQVSTVACEKPDFTVFDVSASSPMCNGGTATLTGVIKNKGTADGSNDVRMALEQSGSIVKSCIVSTPVISIKEGDNEATVSCTVNNLTTGSYSLSGEADYDDSVGELNEDNNKLTETGYSVISMPSSVSNFTHTSNYFDGVVGSLAIDWSWSDVSGEDSYEFYISNDGTNYALRSTVAANSTSYTSYKDYNNVDYDYNTKYWARLYSKNGCGSQYSSASAYTSIETPTGVSVANITGSSADVSANGSFTNLTSGSSGLQYRITNTNSCTSGVVSTSGWLQNTNAYKFTGLSANTTYYACAKARNGDADETNWAGPVSFTTKETTPPTVSVNGAPSSCQNTDASMTISCSDSGSGCNTSRDGYIVYTSNPNTCPTSFSSYTAYSSAVTISSYSWVCGYGEDNDGNSSTAGPTEFKVDKTSPSYTSFSAVSNNCEQATLTVSGASDSGGCGLSSTAYSFSSDNGSTWTSWQSSNSYTYTGLTGGQSYSFVARVRDSAGNTVSTSASSVTPDSCLTAPTAPSGLSFTNVQKTQMTLNWTDNSDNEDGFRVYRNTTNTKPSSAIATLSANTTSYTDTSLSCEQAYYYWVEAYNTAGSSDTSGTRSTLACGSGPTLSASPADSGGWVNSSVSVTLGVSDSDGVSSAKYNWDSSASASVGTSFTNNDTINSPCPGEKTLYMWAVDSLSVESTSSFGLYRCDDVDPTVNSFTVDNINSQNDPVSNTDGTPTVAWNVSDSGGSGISSVEVWRKTGASGTWQKIQTSTSANSSYTDSVPDGTYFYGIHVNDGAGNCVLENGALCSGTGDPIQVDVSTVQPDFSLSSSKSTINLTSGGTGSSATITVSSSGGFSQFVSLSDDCSANGFSCSWGNNPAGCTPASDSSCTDTFTIWPGSKSAGSYTITITGSSSGYTDKTVVLTINISDAPDTQSPTVSVTANPTSATTSWQNTDATAQVSCTDSDSGCDTSSYKLAEVTSSSSCPLDYNQYTLSSPQTVSSNKWLCATAKDNAGNIGYSSAVEFKVDKTRPTFSSFTVEGISVGGSVTISTANEYPTVKWSTSDSESGISNVKLYRALYSSTGCNDTDKSSCVWTEIWSDTNASNTTGRDDTTVTNNTTYYYGMHATDNAGNCTLENGANCSGGTGNPVKVTISWPVKDFGISNSGNVQIEPGGTSKSVTITVTSYNDFSQIVSLSDNCSNSSLTCSWPQGASCQPPANSSCSKTLRIGASSSISAGTYTVKVTGSSSGYTNKTTDISVEVTSTQDNVYPTIDSFSVSYEDGTNNTVYNNTLELTADDPKINWQTSDNVSVSTVKIYRGVDTNSNNSPDSWTEIYSSSSAQSSYIDDGIAEGTYWYKIEVTDSAGNCVDETGADCSTGNSVIGRSTVAPIKVIVDRTVADFEWCVKNSTDVEYTDKSIPGGTTSLSSWVWDFGDDTCPGPADCSQQNPAHTYNTATGYGLFEESGGQVVIEAENWDANVSRGGYSWTENTTYAGYSGSGYMEATPNSGTDNTTGYASSSPELRYDIYFQTTGTYYVWVRGNANANSSPSGNDSVHIGLDGNTVSTAESMTDDDASLDEWNGGFGWSKDREGTTGVATINISTPGLHTLNVWMKEDGFRFDKIILTTSSSYTPTGTGPAQTSKSTSLYKAGLTVTDSQGGEVQSSYQTVDLNSSTACTTNSTPSVPTLTGPTSPGYRGVGYTFTANSTDADGDQITYDFDWNNDDTPDTTIGPVNSGQDTQASTSFNTLGTKCIRSRAKDSQSTSQWSSCYNLDIVNRNPNTPSNPSPADTATSVSLYTDFSFDGGDPDGDLDNVVYTLTVYDGAGQIYGLTPVSKTVKGGTTSVVFTNAEIGGPLTSNESYTWIVTADDGLGGQVTGSTWSFSTGDGCTPKEPLSAPSWTCNADNTANITWDWSPGVSGANDYQLQVSKNDSNFGSSNLVFNNTTNSNYTYTTSNLQAEGGATYYGRVKAIYTATQTEFNDSFTGANGTNLSSHTPDQGGNWVLAYSDGAIELQISGNRLTTGSCGGNQGVLYRTSQVVSSADYEVSAVYAVADSGTDDYAMLVARMLDTNNAYVYEWSQDNGILWKIVSGVKTQLGTTSGVSQGSTVKLKVEGSEITVSSDSSILISVTDTSLTQPGYAGVGMGEIMTPGADCSIQELDDFKVSTSASSCGFSSDWSDVSTVPVSCGLVADYEYCMPDPVNSPSTVSYFDTSSGGVTPYTWEWDFGDGTPKATDQHLTHTFSDNSSNWWNTNWSKRRKIVFDNTGQTENLTDFPVMIKLNGSRIDYAQTQNAGEDLRFVDADGTVLDYEIEKWDESGTSYVWVKVPQIDGGSNTDYIWMYYGNSTATDAQNPSGVWSNGYQAVWHLSENQNGVGNPSLYVDSTANNNYGSDNITAQDKTGKTGDGQEFANSDYIDVADSASLDLTSDITLEAWINPTTINSYARIVAKQHTSDTIPYDMYGLMFDGTTNLRFTVGYRISGYGWIDGSTPISTNQWTYVVGTKAGTDMNTYVNGTLDVNKTLTDGTIRTNDIPVRIGQSRNVTSQQFIGNMDEVRISNVSRSADWIKAQYLSMTDSFFNLSSSFVEESQSSGTGSVYPVTLTVTDNYGLVKTAQKNIDTANTASCAFTITSVTPSSCVSMNVVWDKAVGADSYKIYRSDTGLNGTYNLVATVDAQNTVYCNELSSTCSWEDTGLAQKTQYYYYIDVVRFDSSVERNSNGAQSGTTDSCTPENLVATDNVCGSIDITWQEPLGGLGSDTVEFDDKFTDSNSVEISSHTPTDIGSGWTKVMGNSVLEINTNTMAPSPSCTATDGALYWTNDVMSSPDYEVSVLQNIGDTADDYNILAIRIQDDNSDNVPDSMYAFKWNETNDRNSPGLYKYSSGVWTNLTDITGTTIANGSTVTLKAEGSTITALDDGTVITQYTDSSPITGAGRAGVGMGSVIVPSEDCSGQSLDNFKVLVYGGKYKLYRSTSLSGTYSVIKETTATSYTDEDIFLDKSYYYYVTSVVEGAESNPSNTDSGKSSCFRGPVYIER